MTITRNLRRTGVLAAAAAVAAMAVAPAAQAETTSVPQGWIELKGLHETQAPGYQCPADYPWLVNQRYSDPTMLRGADVQFDEPGVLGIDPRFAETQSDATGLVTGFSKTPSSRGNIATNWDWFTNAFQVVLHCTDNPEQGYRA
jgi:hypothetical protein